MFQYDGSQLCTGIEFGFFVLFGLIVVVVFVFPAPFAVGYICKTRPKVCGDDNRACGVSNCIHARSNSKEFQWRIQGEIPGYHAWIPLQSIIIAIMALLQLPAS